MSAVKFTTKCFTLANGLTVLFRQDDRIPKVAVRMAYKVGSKDETDRNRGMAHFVEHMSFKGTKNLSETDINQIVNKLSGYSNAFTSHDATVYILDLPSSKWGTALKIFAECMTSCTFKQELLNSERCAILQELMMYKDDYPASLMESLLGVAFKNHPYRHPIIGYKEDLFNISPESIDAFYRKFYAPNNAVLTVVGATTLEEVQNLVEANFGSIPSVGAILSDKPSSAVLERGGPAWSLDKIEKVVLKRDIKRPILAIAWPIPGEKKLNKYLSDAICTFLGRGRGSRLYKKLVDELKIAHDVQIFVYGMNETSLLTVYMDPADSVGDQILIDAVVGAISQVEVVSPVDDEELLRVKKRLQAAFSGVNESVSRTANFISSLFLSTGDPEAFEKYPEQENLDFTKAIGEFLSKYILNSPYVVGKVESASEEEKAQFLARRFEEDRRDATRLSVSARTAEIEEARFALQVAVPKLPNFKFPKFETHCLKNGTEIIVCPLHAKDKVSVLVEFPEKHYADLDGAEGGYNFLCNTMLEGTKRLDSHRLAMAIEGRGMGLSISPGFASLSMLKEDFNYGLDLLREVLYEPALECQSVEKVRMHLLSLVDQYWDSPEDFSLQLLREVVYGNTKFRKPLIGTHETINKIDCDTLSALHSRLFLSPRRIVIAGDIAPDRAISAVKANFVFGPLLPEEKPVIVPKTGKKRLHRKINREQTVLVFGGLSLSVEHEHYDAIRILDHIMTGGSAGSMNSRLFGLRERTGLFYAVGGSLCELTAGAPGLYVVRAMLAKDKVETAESLIRSELESAQDSSYVSLEELKTAAYAICYGGINSAETVSGVAGAIMDLKRHHLPDDYYDTQSERLASVTIEKIRHAAESVLAKDNLVTIEIGR